MSEVSVVDAKNNFSKLLEEVESGQEIVITRRGEPVAMLVRAPMKSKKPKLGTLAGLMTLPKGWDAPMTGGEFEEFTNQGKL